jgi:hypothetical protein
MYICYVYTFVCVTIHVHLNIFGKIYIRWYTEVGESGKWRRFSQYLIKFLHLQAFTTKNTVSGEVLFLFKNNAVIYF